MDIRLKLDATMTPKERLLSTFEQLKAKIKNKEYKGQDDVHFTVRMHFIQE
jgi:hypothetical protein